MIGGWGLQVEFAKEVRVHLLVASVWPFGYVCVENSGNEEGVSFGRR